MEDRWTMLVTALGMLAENVSKKAPDDVKKVGVRALELSKNWRAPQKTFTLDCGVIADLSLEEVNEYEREKRKTEQWVNLQVAQMMVRVASTNPQPEPEKPVRLMIEAESEMEKWIVDFLSSKSISQEKTSDERESTNGIQSTQ